MTKENLQKRIHEPYDIKNLKVNGLTIQTLTDKDGNEAQRIYGTSGNLLATKMFDGTKYEFAHDNKQLLVFYDNLGSAKVGEPEMGCIKIKYAGGRYKHKTVEFSKSPKLIPRILQEKEIPGRIEEKFDHRDYQQNFSSVGK